MMRRFTFTRDQCNLYLEHLKDPALRAMVGYILEEMREQGVDRLETDVPERPISA